MSEPLDLDAIEHMFSAGSRSGKKLRAVAAEIRRLREENARQAGAIETNERLTAEIKALVEKIEEVEDVLIEFVGAMYESVNSTDDLATMLRFGKASDAAEALVAKIATRRAGRAS